MEYTPQKLQVKVVANDLTSTEGYLMVVEDSKQVRTSKAMKTFFAFFGAACVSVFIPLVHFILVPLLLITAFFTAQKKMKTIQHIEDAKVLCPHCGKELSVKKTGLNWPMTVFCENDRIFLDIKKA